MCRLWSRKMASDSVIESRSLERDFILAISVHAMGGNSPTLGSRFPFFRLDWPYILGQLLVHRLASLSCVALRDDAAWPSIPSRFRYWISNVYRMNAIQQEHMTAAALEISAELGKHHVPHVFVKGPVLQEQFYPPYSREYNDLDILVDSGDLSRVSNVLGSLDFMQGWLRDGSVVAADRRDAVSARLDSHELVPFWRPTGSDSSPYIKVDVQFEVPGTKPLGLRVSTSLLIADGAAATIGAKFPVLCAEHHLVLLCAHLHMHAFVNDAARNPNDVVLLRMADVIRALVAPDYAVVRRFLDFAASARALPSVAFVVSVLGSLYPDDVPPMLWDVLSELPSNRLDRTVVRDWVFTSERYRVREYLSDLIDS